MGRNYIKKLIRMLLLTVLCGVFLMIALWRNAVAIDRSIVLSTAEILFVLFAALIVLIGLLFFVINLHKEKKQLIALENEITRRQQFGQEAAQNHAVANTRANLPEELTVYHQDAPEEADETEEDASRFFMLNELDARARAHRHDAFEDEVTLSTMCDEFRQFAAYNLGLYYDIADIRRFIGGLAVSHIMILQGMSGTGKTSLAYAFGDYLKNPTTVVPIQPMWKERTDLIGYYNEFTKKFNETTLLQKLYGANHDDQMYITVLDEMNIARVEYYFAEFLSLLELPDQKKRHLDVISDVWETDPTLLRDGKLTLPANMWFIGTANNDDSTFSISDKVYDRAMVINLDKKAQPFIAKATEGRSVSTTKFRQLVKKARKQYALSNRNLRRIREFDKYLMKHYQITFGNRIMQQIINYVPIIIACGGSELSALDDIMAKKVLRKLETKNMVYVKNTAPGLVAFIDELFGETEMLLCKEYIQNIEISA